MTATAPKRRPRAISDQSLSLASNAAEPTRRRRRITDPTDPQMPAASFFFKLTVILTVVRVPALRSFAPVLLNKSPCSWPDLGRSRQDSRLPKRKNRGPSRQAATAPLRSFSALKWKTGAAGPVHSWGPEGPQQARPHLVAAASGDRKAQRQTDRLRRQLRRPQAVRQAGR